VVLTLKIITDSMPNNRQNNLKHTNARTFKKLAALRFSADRHS